MKPQPNSRFKAGLYYQLTYAKTRPPVSVTITRKMKYLYAINDIHFFEYEGIAFAVSIQKRWVSAHMPDGITYYFELINYTTKGTTAHDLN